MMRRSARHSKPWKMNRKTYELMLFIKFGLVGVLGMGVSAAIFLLLTYRLPPETPSLNYIIPYFLSVESGILVTFIPNDRWVFKEEKNKLSLIQRFLTYHGALFGGFLLQTGIFLFLLFMPISKRVAYFVGMVAAALWNYLISRKAVFI